MLISLFYDSGALATICLFATLPHSHQAIRQITASLMLSMASIIASRLILNLRVYARSSRLNTDTLVTAANLTCMSAHIDFINQAQEDTGESGMHQSNGEDVPQMWAIE